jgi:DNA-binding NtrC family response regulator
VQNKLKILVIEDDGLNRDILVTLLSEYGELFEASTVASAKKIISLEKFDLAFVDLDLHGVKSGFNLAKELKEKGTYTVILSAQRDAESVQKGFQVSNCDNYLFKPANLSLIKDLMNHYLGQNGINPIDELIKSKMPSTCSQLLDALEIVKTIAPGNAPVYLFGPTGAGKQVLA